MKTSSMVSVLGVVLVALLLGWYFWNKQSTPVVETPQTPTEQTSTTTPTPTPAAAAANTETPTPAAVPDVVAAPRAVAVAYDGKNFSPKSVTIAKGGTVTFTSTAPRMWVAADEHPTHTKYDSTTKQEHCVAGAPASSFDQCASGTTYSFAFTKAGSWEYHDHTNASAAGVVIVQ